MRWTIKVSYLDFFLRITVITVKYNQYHNAIHPARAWTTKDIICEVIITFLVNIRLNYNCILFKKRKATTSENRVAMSDTPPLTARIHLPVKRDGYLLQMNWTLWKKINLSSVSESDFGTFDIVTPGAELPIHSSEMNSEEFLDMDSQVTDSQSLLSQVVVTLKDTDLEKIGEILRDTFQLEVKDSTSSVIKSQASRL